MTDGRSVVIWRSGLLSGSETFIRNHGTALTTWRPTFLGATKISSYLAADSDVIAFANTSRDRYAYNLLRVSGESPRLRAVLARLRPAIVHAHFGGDAWMISRSTRALNIPLIVTVHGHDVTRQPAMGGLRGARYRRNLRDAFDRASLIIAVSEFIRDKAIEAGADPAKVRVHYTGIPMPPRPQLTAPMWDAIFVGRFVEKKGVDDIIEALGALGELRPRTAFIGTGPLEAALRARSAALGLDATFLGAQEPEEVGRHLAASKILLAPSKTAADGDSEGLPTTLLEAASHGVPAVSTYHSGIPEAVIHGETGLLGPERDRSVLAGHIRRLLTDDTLRLTLGQTARAHVETHFDLATQTQQLEEVYETVAGRAHTAMAGGRYAR